MAKTATQSKTVSKTKLAVATAALLAAGGAAYGFGVLPGQIGYENMYVQCHNQATVTIED